MRRAKKRPAASVAEEITAHGETEALFKSNFFRLQTAELLREVAPAYTSPALHSLEGSVRQLRETLLGLPPAHLSWEAGGAGAEPAVSHAHLAGLSPMNSKVHLSWRPAEKVSLTGSYLLRTLARPCLNVDLALHIPGACLHEKDFLDHRYTDKRLLYLAHLAELLCDEDAPWRSPRLAWLPHAQHAHWPVVELEMPVGGETWRVRIIPALARAVFAPAKLRPGRANLRQHACRPGSDAPRASADYNNAIALESTHGDSVELLHSFYSRDSSGALREASVLLKVWARQRSTSQAGSVALEGHVSLPCCWPMRLGLTVSSVSSVECEIRRAGRRDSS